MSTLPTAGEGVVPGTSPGASYIEPMGLRGFGSQQVKKDTDQTAWIDHNDWLPQFLHEKDAL